MRQCTSNRLSVFDVRRLNEVVVGTAGVYIFDGEDLLTLGTRAPNATVVCNGLVKRMRYFRRRMNISSVHNIISGTYRRGYCYCRRKVHDRRRGPRRTWSPIGFGIPLANAGLYCGCVVGWLFL